MGHEVVYCRGCQTRIHGSEIEKGKAFDYGGGFCCRACVPQVLPTLPPAERQRLQAAMQRPPGESRDQSSSSTGLRRMPPLSSSSTAMRRPVPGSSARIPLADAPAPGTRRLAPARGSGPLVGAALGAAALVVLAAFLLLSRKPPPPEPPARSTASAPRTAAPAADVPPAFREARDYAQLRPSDLDGQIQRWEKAAWALEGSPSLEEAKRRLAAARAARQDLTDRALATLEAELAPDLQAEAFGRALQQIERARPRFSHPEWTLGLERRVDRIQTAAADRFAQLRDDVLRTGEGRAVVAARVARWGLPKYDDRLQELLATPAAPAPAPAPAAPPPPPPKADAYRPVWEKAAALAGLRDYAAAQKELESARALDPEAAGDLELLKAVAAVPAEAREALGRWPRGQKQAVDVLDAAGRPFRLEAVFQRPENGRLLFGAGAETLPVEPGELAPSTLAALFLARAKKAEGDERAAAAFCLFEGDVEGAGRFKATLAVRYWDWGRKVAAERSGGREAEARGLFAAAEDGAADPLRAAQAVAVYKDLLARYGDTAFVARNRASITARTAGAREFVFGSDDLAGTGGFRPSKPAKGEPAWTVERDGEAGVVELAYSALPGVEYRAWAYAGACCLETFEFGVQATGLFGAEPGTSGRMPAKIPFFLRKTHASHGGPKAPSRWDWVPLPMPPAGEGGARTLQIHAAQQGFSVAYVVVSAAPDFAPRLLEIRERARAVRPAPAPPEAGLVGHWAFDDGQGAVATDGSPRRQHGKVVGAAWTPGRFGGGLRFDGVDSHVELPSSPALDDLQERDYTLSAWFKPEGVPAGKDDQNDAGYGLLIKKGHHAGLSYRSGEAHFHHWYETECVGATAVGPWPLGTFRHVAATYGVRTGQMQVYLDGRPAGGGVGKPGQAAREFGAEPWRVGIAWPGASEWRWAAKGVIDEVRIYDRVLSLWEVRALAEARPAPAAPRAAPDARPWTALPLDTFVNSGFRMENGVLTRIQGADDAARSATDFGDAEIRIRFEHTVSGYLFFAVRQTGEGAFVVDWNRNDIEPMAGKEHELLFVCKGDAVSATLDGRALTVHRRGSPLRSGSMQFNMNPPAELRIKSIEVRDPR